MSGDYPVGSLHEHGGNREQRDRQNRSGLDDLDIRLTSETINAEPRKLNMTIDTRSPCGWLQQITRGFAMWECEEKNHGMNEMLPSGWGYYACPRHGEGGDLRAEAEAGLAKVVTVKPTPLADEAEAYAAKIKRDGDALERIQKAINDRGDPTEYTATLNEIRDIIHEWEDE